jgi:acyl-coenzyme A synthetase/AMP-(fatty) acid ligase
VVPGVPVLYELMEKFSQFGPFDLTGVRTVTNTGAALLPRHIEIVQRLMPKAAIFSMYGVTESKRCTYLPPALIDIKPGSVGVAIPNTEVSVLDDAGRPCAPHEIGQIVIRGGTVMRGYWGNPEATAEKIREHPVRGGRCLFTGDYGYLDEDGHLFFKGRMDEVVKVRGRKLVPRDVEDALRALDEVVDASVVCTERDDAEPEIAAFVQAVESTVEEATLRAGCARSLESYQVPTRFQLVDRLPRNENGKVDKIELRRRYPVEGS